MAGWRVHGRGCVNVPKSRRPSSEFFPSTSWRASWWCGSTSGRKRTIAKRHRGGPAQTQYVKETRLRFEIGWELDQAAWSKAEREDGLFPLISNDRTLTAEQVLRAYKRQPLVEKRFSQFKTDFAVAPVYLQDVARISGLLAVYFFALMAQTLLERELRRAMSAAGIQSLPLYPEGRPCARPTAH